MGTLARIACEDSTESEVAMELLKRMKGLFVNEVAVQRPGVALNRKQKRAAASIARKQAQRRKVR